MKRFTFSCALVACWCLPAVATDWVFQTVQTYDQLRGGVPSSIDWEVDGSGRPHMVYAYGSARYATIENGVWRVESVGAGGGRDASMSVDENGTVHVARISTYTLFYSARPASGGWTTETVQSDIDFHGVGIGLMPDGTPSIGWNGNNDRVTYAERINSSWQIAAGMDIGQIGGFAMAMDGTGTPHFTWTYMQTYPRRMWYATYDGTWHYDNPFPQSAGMSWYSSIAVDSQNRPFIAFYREGTNDLYFLSNTLGVWTSEVVASAGDVGAGVSLAIDSHDVPHLAYWDGSNNAVMHGWRDASGWNLEQVSAHARYPSIAVGADGSVHLAFYDTDYGSLIYAVPEPAAISLLALGGLALIRRRRR